jgi:dTDP-4-amino-4,6-dideoxygalactose transaminase
MKIAKDAGILLIEDAAHAIYAKSRGRMIGSIGNAAGFSFYATKNLCIGEGGMLTTDDPEIAKKVQVLRLHGISRDAWKRYSFNRGWKYEVKAAGFKYNMTDLQAAIGLCQLKKLEKMQKVREKIATTYLEKLINLPGIILPDTRLAPDDRHAWHLFPIRLISEMAGLTRDEFINQMGQLGVGTSVHFLPLHLQPYYREVFGTREGQLPVTEKVAQEIVSLPIYPKMTKLDVEKVIKAICQITSKAGKLAKR